MHNESAMPDAQQFLEFLNALPTTLNSVQWLTDLQAIICRLFPEIDHLAMVYNMLDEKHRNGPLDSAHMSISPDETSRLGFSADAVPHGQRERIESVIEVELESLGQPREFFYPPTIFNYYDTAWLGSIIIFRQRSRSPFSEGMLSVFADLYRFMVFAFKDHSLRYHAEHPADTLYWEAVTQITEQMGLTQQEMRVVMFRLLGRSYKEIGEMLSLSPSTVKNHLTAVHRKAGVHTQSELFARYFAPRFGLFTRISGKSDSEDTSP